MARKSIQNILILVLTLSISILAAGCTLGAGSDDPGAKGTPGTGSTFRVELPLFAARLGA